MRNPFNPLRGWHVLILILMFFGVTIGVNAT
ncbi:MAG: nitrogen fixation protein FixH, partial [Maricaulis maris]